PRLPGLVPERPRLRALPRRAVRRGRAGARPRAAARACVCRLPPDPHRRAPGTWADRRRPARGCRAAPPQSDLPPRELRKAALRAEGSRPGKPLLQRLARAGARVVLGASIAEQL